MNDREIRIDNLTPEQVEMLNIMWSIDTYQDYQEWIDNLSYEEAEMADHLQKLLILAAGDSIIEDELDTTEAREYLKKFRIQK